ncbi:hypothetical protein Tco_0536704 [Tanacetum coccineum]
MLAPWQYLSSSSISKCPPWHCMGKASVNSIFKPLSESNNSFLALEVQVLAFKKSGYAFTKSNLHSLPGTPVHEVWLIIAISDALLTCCLSSSNAFDSSMP